MSNTTISKERLEMLVQYLSTDNTKTQELLALSVEEACKIINADGYDFIPEELIALGAELEKTLASSNEELSEESLDDVSGGGVGWALLREIAKVMGGPIAPIW